jgi:opine dehydrogenase
VLNRQGSIAVLGAGHGGLALAGYLALHGQRVALWNRSPGRIQPVSAQGGIHLSLPGSEPLFVPIAVATCYMGDALAEARLVLVAVPASGHADVARQCALYLGDGHTVLLLPGRTGGALEFRRVLRQAGCRARVLLGESSTFPFASRCVGPASAVICAIKAEVLAAALPASRTPVLLAACRSLPMLSPARSVLHTGIENIGAILHPIITLLNAGRIESGVGFRFYSEGVTPHVARVLAAADAERIQIARAYGVPYRSLPAWVAATYGHHGNDMQTAVGSNPGYAAISAPTTVVHRYLLEDVPTGLIPLLELGEAAGLAVPTLRTLADMAHLTLGSDSWQRPRTLESLGLDGTSPEEIRLAIEGEPILRPRFVASCRRSGVSARSSRSRSDCSQVSEVRGQRSEISAAS